ncbi:DUF6660 family protein [Rufibacter soli]
MKWFAVLLSVFMIVMSCVPCADAAQGEDTLAQTNISSNQDSDAHSPVTDLCSPLCICNCCAGFTLLTANLKTNSLVVKITIQEPIYQEVAARTPTFSIWQPPRL